MSVRKALDAVGGAGNITITRCEKHRNYEMRKLDEVARALKVSAVDLYIQIVKDGGAGIVCKAMTEADMRRFLQQPWVMVASDGGVGMRHPRGAAHSRAYWAAWSANNIGLRCRRRFER